MSEWIKKKKRKEKKTKESEKGKEIGGYEDEYGYEK